MNILLIYPPFCTPVTPPYSITNLYNVLKNNTSHNIKAIDLNIEFHKLKFGSKFKTFDDYEKQAADFKDPSIKVYMENHKMIRNDKAPEFFDELLQQILKQKPDIAAFSIIYSSQTMYTYMLIKKLKSLGIKTIIGGTSVSQKLIEIADKHLDNEIELLEYLNAKLKNEKRVLDFSIYNLDDYFTPKTVLPIKTSSSCYYRQCAFCTHYCKTKYKEYPIEEIKETIVKSKQKFFFFIDDMITKKRLLEIAESVKPLNVSWTCQLKPTKELDYETLKALRESGLKIIIWGVESGSDRILKLMNKGTNIKDISHVLKDSKRAGIVNITYIIFGFPTETKEEFMETMDFLKNNSESIDLVSSSVFGLQAGSDIYKNPAKYKITKIIEEQRTMLDPKVTYEVSEGLTQEQATKLKGKYRKAIERINKHPKTMNYFREHMLCMI